VPGTASQQHVRKAGETVTIRQREFDVLCAEVDAGRLTEAEVIRWMRQTGWPGHSQIECWQWWDGQYAAWKARTHQRDTTD
jgi:hypothetical protein